MTFVSTTHLFKPRRCVLICQQLYFYDGVVPLLQFFRMGDSEDEYDRKRRDKFRGERAEASYRGAERPVRPRDDWPER